MADIATSILEVGSNRLILQDAEARTKINDMYITDTASGAIASFPDGADNVPVKSLTVNIEPVQSGTGDPSPTNIRPISGHTSATVTRTGKNLFDWNNQQSFTGFINTAIQKFTAQSGYKVAYIECEPNTTYTISKEAGKTFRIATSEQAPSGNVSYIGTSANHIGTSITYTTESNAKYLAVMYWSSANGDTKTADELAQTLQFEIGSTATEYNAYNSQTYTIDLDGTRYGGTLDVGTGVLTVDRAVVDLGSLTWNYDSGLSRYESSVISDMKPSAARTGYILSDRYQSITDGRPSGNVPNNSIYTVIEKKIFVVDNAYSSASSFKTAVTGSLAIYPLATPLTIQLTANEISTLLGQNNIWSDAGDVEVEYRADTKLYIDKKIAELA